MTTSAKASDVLVEFPEVAESSTVSSETTITFADKVNDAVNSMTQKEDGTWELPKGLSEEVQFAANAERRRRDTQSAFDRTRQELTISKSKAEKLEAKLLANVQLSLTNEEREELAELKETNPDAWRAKLNEHEETARTRQREELETIDDETSQLSEIERRESVLKDFLDKNPGLVLNDDVFENDLPPRITGKLARGEISFEDFLEEAKTSIQRTTKIAGSEEEEEEPQLGKAGGGDRVSDAAVTEDDNASYENTIF